MDGCKCMIPGSFGNPRRRGPKYGLSMHLAHIDDVVNLWGGGLARKMRSRPAGRGAL